MIQRDLERGEMGAENNSASSLGSCMLVNQSGKQRLSCTHLTVCLSGGDSPSHAVLLCLPLNAVVSSRLLQSRNMVTTGKEFREQQLKWGLEPRRYLRFVLHPKVCEVPHGAHSTRQTLPQRASEQAFSHGTRGREQTRWVGWLGCMGLQTSQCSDGGSSCSSQWLISF